MHFFTFTYNNEKQFLQMQIFFFYFIRFLFFYIQEGIMAFSVYAIESPMKPVDKDEEEEIGGVESEEPEAEEGEEDMDTTETEPTTDNTMGSTSTVDKSLPEACQGSKKMEVEESKTRTWEYQPNLVETLKKLRFPHQVC